MTATDWDQTNHTDYGAADSLGSGSAAPIRRRRKGDGVLDNPFTAQLVADELRAWANTLDQSGEHLPARTALIRQAATEITER